MRIEMYLEALGRIKQNDSRCTNRSLFVNNYQNQWNIYEQEHFLEVEKYNAEILDEKTTKEWES